MHAKTTCLGLAISLISLVAQAEEMDDYREIYQVTWENDIFSGEDGRYTNGLGFSWGKGPVDEFNDDVLPGWLQTLASPLPGYNDPGYDFAISYTISQVMQTPTEIDRSEPDPDDYPYAGLLSWGARMHFVGDDIAYEPNLLLGVVGPWSLAEQSQKLIHKITDSTEPEGWDEQLRNEPVINLGFITRWRTFKSSPGGLEWDVVPRVGAFAGNLRSLVVGSVNFRIGGGLGESWSQSGVLVGRNPDPLTGSGRGSWYVSVGAGAQYVFNALLVEGNTWKSSPGLDLEHSQNFWGASASYSFGKISVILNYVDRSDRAEQASGGETFGSLSVAWALD